MGAIASAMQDVRARIAGACRDAGRPQAEVSLLAVSKTFPAAAIREAWAAGQRHFGESYLQEALAKMAELADLDIEWHFIGPIQANKTRPIAEHFHWVHAVDRLRIAERLSDQRPPGLPPLRVCVQVNVSGEPSKHGVAPDEVLELAAAVAGLPGIRLRGFMAIPAPEARVDRQRAQFRVLADLLRAARARGLDLDTLSMGMSDDMEAAILEGATIIRIGTAIFGRRRTWGR
ncbi:MAG TPA: YggS family pyridoxal phosphate-dependent enzyme [Thiobacillaceae bacterium]|nr:YggS family pyridoxal phosphate-dependent enzyme [Thiobacillaceae bacterium]